jgi:CheY-like chemotaxis protein
MEIVRNILIVEDSYFNQVLLEAIVNDMGYEAKISSKGEDALKMIQEEKFDLIILDLMMPGMDGFIFLNEKRKLKDKTPVIVVSAKADEATRKRVKSLGVNDFVSKPLKSENFTTLIAKYLNP